jgi:hypothetical protein
VALKAVHAFAWLPSLKLLELPMRVAFRNRKRMRICHRRHFVLDEIDGDFDERPIEVGWPELDSPAREETAPPL